MVGVSVLNACFYVLSVPPTPIEVRSCSPKQGDVETSHLNVTYIKIMQTDLGDTPEINVHGDLAYVQLLEANSV